MRAAYLSSGAEFLGGWPPRRMNKQAPCMNAQVLRDSGTACLTVHGSLFLPVTLTVLFPVIACACFIPACVSSNVSLHLEIDGVVVQKRTGFLPAKFEWKSSFPKLRWHDGAVQRTTRIDKCTDRAADIGMKSYPVAAFLS